MAHNAVIHGGTGAPTAWLPGYVVSQLDFQTFDQRQFESINGDLGGTWAPAALIILGGAGLQTTGPFTASGTNLLSGATTVSGTATFSNTVTFTSNVTHQAPSTVWNTMTVDGAHSGEIKWNSAALLTGQAGAVAAWSGAWTFKNGLTIDTGLFQVTSITRPVFSSGLLLGDAGSTFESVGPAIFDKNVTLGSLASILIRYLSGPDADTTIAAQTYDRVRIGPITGASNRNYTLADAANGTEIIVTMRQAIGSGTNTVTLKDGGGGTIVVLKFQQAGQIDRVHMLRTGGNWIVFDYDQWAVT